MNALIKYGMLVIGMAGLIGCNNQPTDEPPETTQSEEPVITAEYTFACVPGGVASDELISDVIDGPGDEIYIRPSDENCKFHLIHKNGGIQQQITDSPGGHILVAAVMDTAGRTLVCSSNIYHSQIPDAYDPDTGDYGHNINAVNIECAVRDAGSWSGMQPVVAPDLTWAAWINTLEAIDDPTPRYVMTYTRDFSFQFLNIGDLGRPGTDGIYQLTFEYRPGEGLVELENVKLSDTIRPEEGVELEGWGAEDGPDPDFPEIVVDDGDCADGCPMDDTNVQCGTGGCPGLCWAVLDTQGEYPSLKALSGTSSSDVYAVGEWGTIMHFDGTDWLKMDSDTELPLNGVWAVSTSDAFAVGSRGKILRYDGSAWARMDRVSVNDLNGVWASSANHAVAVGAGGTLIEYDGLSWRGIDSGTLNNLNAVGGSSGDDVFVVGDDALILHFDGTAWSRVRFNFSLDDDLTGVWALSASAVFVVGQGGTILFFDGFEFYLMENAGVESLSGVWGTSPSDVYAVGDSGTVLHFDGTDWIEMERAACGELAAIWGSSTSDIYAAGSQEIMHYTDRP